LNKITKGHQAKEGGEQKKREQESRKHLIYRSEKGDIPLLFWIVKQILAVVPRGERDRAGSKIKIWRKTNLAADGEMKGAQRGGSTQMHGGGGLEGGQQSGESGQIENRR